ncbi:MAG: TonB-dependent receptor [Thermoanaerobaculia bacterium]
MLVAAIVALLTTRVSYNIVVTAERGQTSLDSAICAMTVLDGHTIVSTPSTNAADLLMTIPGITFFQSSSTTPATITSRGFYGGGEVDQTQLRVDGVPVADVESNLAPWQQLRMEEIERIEVVRGLASPLYGDVALGGVVQIFTRQRESSHVAATLTRGNFDTTDAAARLSLTSDYNELGVFLDYRDSDGDRPHAAAERRGVRAHWRKHTNSKAFVTALDWRAHEREDPGPLPLSELDSRSSDPLFALDRDDTTRRQLSFSAYAIPWNAYAYASSKSNEATRTILILPPFADTASRELDSSEIGGSFTFTREKWRAGVDASAQQFDVDWEVARADERRRSLAAWGTRHVSLGKRALLTGSMRVDSIDDTTAWSPRLGVATGFGHNSFYVSAGRGFKAPSLEQLYDVRPLRLFGDTFTLANPDLEPQRARSLEAGGRGRRWSLDAYLTRVTNEIDFDPQTFRYGNIARSEHRGVEAMFTLPSSDALVPRVTYAWSRVFSLDDPSRAQLKNVPEHSATAMLTARLPRKFLATAFYTWNAGRYYDDAEQIAAPDTHSLSLRLQKELGPAALRIDVLNATNATNAGLGYALADITGGVSTYAYPDVRRSIRVSVVMNPRYFN